MSTRCVEYWLCVEYRFPTNQLYTKICSDHGLDRLTKRRRNLEMTPDEYTKRVVITFAEAELLRRGKINEAGLIEAVLRELPTTGILVYYNNTSIIIAVKIFFTTDCLLDSS